MEAEQDAFHEEKTQFSPERKDTTLLRVKIQMSVSVSAYLSVGDASESSIAEFRLRIHRQSRFSLISSQLHLLFFLRSFLFQVQMLHS